MKKLKVSVVIPHVSFPEADEALKRCVASLRGHDEIIIVLNDGIGFGAAVNKGLEVASGDIIWVVNNDTELIEGSLQQAFYSCITVPVMHGQPDWKPRAFYALPRWIYEEVGGYDERFEIGYFEDDDIMKRWAEFGCGWKISPYIEVSHLNGGGLTVKRYGEEMLMNANRQKFVEKWGELP